MQGLLKTEVENENDWGVPVLIQISWQRGEAAYF